MTKRQAIAITTSTTTTSTTTYDETFTDHNSNSVNNCKRNRNENTDKNDEDFPCIAADMIDNEDITVITENHEFSMELSAFSVPTLFEPFATAFTESASPEEAIPPEPSSVVSLFHNVDALGCIASFIGPNQFRYVAGINQGFRTAYTELFPECVTTYCNISTIQQAKMCYEETKEEFTNGHLRRSVLCDAAAKNGNLPVLQYFRLMGCAWDVCTCAHAAASGDLNVLQWIRQEGCPWNELTCEYAAKHGHLHVLQWARECGCPWDRSTCIYAVAYNHLDIFEWAVKNGCPICDESISVTADLAGNRSICERILNEHAELSWNELYFITGDVIFDDNLRPEWNRELNINVEYDVEQELNINVEQEWSNAFDDIFSVVSLDLL